MRIRNFLIVFLLSLIALLHVHHDVFAQDDGLDPAVSEIESFLVRDAENSATGLADQACSFARLSGTPLLGQAILEDLSSFVPSFESITATACYRDMMWAMEDEAEVLLAAYGEASYQICTASSSQSIGGAGEGSASNLADLQNAKDQIYNQRQSLRDALRFLRNFGAQADLNSAELLEVLGVNRLSDDVSLEVLGVSGRENNPYYNPLFAFDNILGVDTLPGSPIPQYYSDFVSSKLRDQQIRSVTQTMNMLLGKAKTSEEHQEIRNTYQPILAQLGESSDEGDYSEKVKLYALAGREKWGAMESALNAFFSRPHNGIREGNTDDVDRDAYPAFYDLGVADRVALYSHLKALQVALPYMQRYIQSCGVSSADQAIARISASFDNMLDVFDQFGDTLSYPFSADDPNSKAQQRIKERRIVRLERICDRVERMYKKSGRSLHELPVIATIDGQRYCDPPDNQDQSFSERQQDAENRASENIVPARGLDDIAQRDIDVTIEDAMVQRLSDESRYLRDVDIAKTYATYQALYDGNNQGAVSALRDLFDRFNNVLLFTISDHPERDGDPITRSIFTTLFEVQDIKGGSGCTTCSVQESDFRIRR